jgi:hypothetical protein
MCSLYRNEYSNLKLAEAAMGRGLVEMMHGNNTRNLYIYVSLSQTSKNAMLVLFYSFFLTKSENKRTDQVLPEMGVRGEVAQIMYTCVSKCKNDKNKIK